MGEKILALGEPLAVCSDICGELDWQVACSVEGPPSADTSIITAF